MKLKQPQCIYKAQHTNLNKAACACMQDTMTEVCLMAGAIQGLSQQVTKTGNSKEQAMKR